MRFNINSDAVVAYTNKLEKLSRSALPVAIRGALNNAAFDVKKNTMPAKAKAAFTQRKPTFFKANSKVEPAQGLKMESMKATVGFVPKGGKDQSVSDLEQQESGGNIPGRSFITTRFARSGNAWNKSVRAAARIGRINRVINTRKAGVKNNRNSRQAFVKSAVHAGKGGYVIGSGPKGENTLFEVRSIKRIGGNTVIKTLPIYTYEKGRNARVKATGFMRTSSLESGGKIERFFIEQAKRQIDKLK